MKVHQQIIESLSQVYQKNPENIALFVTGSVARNEETKNSDLDLLLVTKTQNGFKESDESGITVEIKSNTLAGFLAKMDENPMNIYQWLDAKVIFDDTNILSKLTSHAQKILESYSPPEFPRKWLDSAKIKIISAQEAGNELSLGFQVSNILWKIVEAFYTLNSQPLPPNTTAFRRINTLQILPQNFDDLWQKTLTGNLKERADATIKLLEFLLNKK